MLKDKIAVVNAAGQGIGRAIAERLKAEGAIVYASDVNAGLLEGSDFDRVDALDGTDYDAVKSYFASIEKVDVMVHAIGYVHQGTIEECRPEDWQRSVNISLSSAYNVLHHAVPKMKDKGGSIVVISSVVSSTKGFPKRFAYGTAKAGLIGMTKSIAADYLPFGIRANAVCPGTVDSPSLRERIKELAEQMGSEEEAYNFFISRQPSGRFGTPEEIAGVCAMLASDESALITGQVINVDGGITI